MNANELTFEFDAKMSRDLCLQKIGALCDFDRYFWHIFVLLAFIVGIIVFRKNKPSKKNVNPVLIYVLTVVGIYILLAVFSLYLHVQGGYLHYPWDFNNKYFDLIMDPIFRICPICEDISQTMTIILTGEIPIN